MVVKPHLAISQKMSIFAEMARQCTDIDEILRLINLRLRKLEKSDSEKTEEIGRLNRVIGQKDVEIHNLKVQLSSTKSELANAKARIKELEDKSDEEDGSSISSRKPEKNSSNSSVPPSQESIAARELRRTKSLRKPSGKPSGGQPGHKGSTLQSVNMPDRIIKHEPAYCKCCGRSLDSVGYRKIRKTQIVDIRFVVETTEEQYYEKVCQCGCVNNCDAPNCRIKYGDNTRALVSYLNAVQCIPFKRIAEVISDLCGQRISEGTIQNIPYSNSFLRSMLRNVSGMMPISPTMMLANGWNCSRKRPRPVVWLSPLLFTSTAMNFWFFFRIKSTSSLPSRQ